MGGVPAPQTVAFPSASEPKPIMQGLRGQGPMQITMPTTPAAPGSPGPAGPNQPPTPPAQAGGYLGDPYSYSPFSGANSLQNIQSGAFGVGGTGLSGGQ